MSCRYVGPAISFSDTYLISTAESNFPFCKGSALGVNMVE